MIQRCISWFLLTGTGARNSGHILLLPGRRRHGSSAAQRANICLGNEKHKITKYLARKNCHWTFEKFQIQTLKRRNRRSRRSRRRRRRRRGGREGGGGGGEEEDQDRHAEEFEMLKFLQCRCISSGPSFSVRKFTLISPARKEEENSNLYHLYIYIYFYINISGFPSLFPFHSDTNSTKENVNFFTMEETFPLGLILIDSPHLHTAIFPAGDWQWQQCRNPARVA